MNSRVISFFLALLTKLNTCYEGSMCCRIFNKVWSALGRAFSGSFIYRFFTSEKYAGIWDNSIFGKVVNFPQRILIYLQKKLSPWLNNQLQNSILCGAFSKWSTVSVRVYGLSVLSFSVLTTFLRNNSVFTLALLIVLEILGLLLVIINRSISQIISGSLVAKLIGEIFTEFKLDNEKAVAVKMKHYIIAVVVGAFASVVCTYVGILEMVLIFGAILAIAFLLKYPLMSVFMTVALSPVLPTMVLVGLSFVCAVVFVINVIKDDKFTFVKLRLNGVVVFFAISLLWGVVNSFDRFSSLQQVMVHGSFILFYFVLVNMIRTKKQWLILLKVFIASAFVVAVYGIIQNFFGVSSTDSWIDEKMFKDIGQRVYSFFNNPNVLGEFLVLTIPVAAALTWNKVREGHKVLFASALLCMALCMVFTWSRGAWLGVIIAMAMFLVIADKRWMLVGLFGIMLVPVLLYATGNISIIERFMSIGNTDDTSTAYRVSIWNAAVQIIKDFGLRGIGIGSNAFEKIYPSYALPGAEFALHSHNLYLQYIVETGILGIVSLFGLLLGYFKTVFSPAIIKRIKTSDVSKLTVALGAGLVGFLFQGLTDYVWYNYKMLLIFWIVVALGASGAQILKEENKGGDS